MKDMPLPLLLEGVKSNIVPLVELLSKAPATIIRTQFGELDPPLGAMRLRVIECLAPLFLSQNDEIRAALLRSSALSSILVRDSSMQSRRDVTLIRKDINMSFICLCFWCTHSGPVLRIPISQHHAWISRQGGVAYTRRGSNRIAKRGAFCFASNCCLSVFLVLLLLTR
jgi:hypothetical protein